MQLIIKEVIQLILDLDHSSINFSPIAVSTAVKQEEKVDVQDKDVEDSLRLEMASLCQAKSGLIEKETFNNHEFDHDNNDNDDCIGKIDHDEKEIDEVIMHDINTTTMKQESGDSSTKIGEDHNLNENVNNDNNDLGDSMASEMLFIWFKFLGGELG